MVEKQQYIVVVEDDVAIQYLEKLTLEAEGYAVLTTGSSEEAIPLLEELRPALVLIDLQLPGMDGFGLTQHIRATSEVPIIMVTGRGEMADKVRGLETGADCYLTKPFSPKELAARTEAVLRRASIG
jgi:DNA-binding response OmpR family regulator